MKITGTFTLGYSNFAITNLRRRNYSFTHTGLTLTSSTEMALHVEEERKKSATGQTTDNVLST